MCISTISTTPGPLISTNSGENFDPGIATKKLILGEPAHTKTSRLLVTSYVPAVKQNATPVSK